MRALMTMALTVALAGSVAAQYQDQTQQNRQDQTQQQMPSQTERQDQTLPQTDLERQDTTADPATTGTSGQFGAEQQNLPATASPLPWILLAGLSSLGGAWAVRRFRL